MSRSLRAIAVSSCLLAAGVSSTAVAAAPTLRAHSLFGAPQFHVGAVALIDAHHAPGKITEVCMDPAPIDQPSCSASHNLAPSKTGTTKVKATFADGSSATTTLNVKAAARKVGGMVPVPGHVTCKSVTLYGNYDTKTDRFRGKLATVGQGSNVALYNRIGKRALFMWNYKTNKSGFGSVSCAKPGLN